MKFLVKLFFRMAIFLTLFLLGTVIFASAYHCFSYAGSGLSDLFVRRGHSFDESFGLVLNGACLLVIAVYHGILTLAVILLAHHKVWTAYKSETGRGDKRIGPLFRLMGYVAFAYIAVAPWYVVSVLAQPAIYWAALAMILIDVVFFSFATGK